MNAWMKVKEDITRKMRGEIPHVKRRPGSVSEKADHLAQIGKLRYQIFLFEQKAEKNFSEIGERLFELAEANGAKNPLSDPTIKKKLADAKKIERKLKSLHDKMAQLRERAA
ncbi:hypothetical protein [Candidatus Manganitrophus noduliformans]|uniref:Uncharacterized protein n=1 Tax=Candidatus Manganitrophus noduliformans TaxID=2606439 RepID=A0A7X6IBS2_9BACT|nr:hypothetical protein [Candidatus Manganitrophus noduliformans]NKE71709.1 hypothetical protein [Candidatus Manganitrophus noduliformans]